jgi:hypothetical protein
VSAVTESAAVDLFLLAEGDMFVGAFGGHMSRLAFELLVGLRGRVVPYVSGTRPVSRVLCLVSRFSPRPLLRRSRSALPADRRTLLSRPRPGFLCMTPGLLIAAHCCSWLLLLSHRPTARARRTHAHIRTDNNGARAVDRAWCFESDLEYGTGFIDFC